MRKTINLDDELAEEYLAECQHDLNRIELDLLAIEKDGEKVNEEVVNRVLVAVHSIQVGASFLDLVKIGELAHRMEEALGLIRSRRMVPSQERVSVLLAAADRLQELLQNAGASNQADLEPMISALAGLPAPRAVPGEGGGTSEGGREPHGSPQIRVLLVEDDFACRLLMQTFLSRHGECHVAVNGREAVEAFRTALDQGRAYDVICMDIMMPVMDGREAVRQVREMEEVHGILPPCGAKIIMTTTVDDIKEVFRCFRTLCDAYLTKPIDLAELLSHVQSYQGLATGSLIGSARG